MGLLCILVQRFAYACFFDLFLGGHLHFRDECERLFKAELIEDARHEDTLDDKFEILTKTDRVPQEPVSFQQHLHTSLELLLCQLVLSLKIFHRPEEALVCIGAGALVAQSEKLLNVRLHLHGQVLVRIRFVGGVLLGGGRRLWHWYFFVFGGFLLLD